MSQIYISGPYSFASGVRRVAEIIKSKSIENKVVYNERGTAYQPSKLEQSDYVVFVLDDFAWQQTLENISKGVLSELLWCINHRIPMFLAYKSANGLQIYGTEIDHDLNFKGVAGTGNNFYSIVANFIDAPDYTNCNFTVGGIAFDGTARLSGESPITKESKSYFY